MAGPIRGEGRGSAIRAQTKLKPKCCITKKLILRCRCRHWWWTSLET